MSEYSVIPMVLAAVLVLQVECVQSVNNGGCGQQLCGDVIIKYPFGIGPNCSLDNDYYAVSCDNSSLPHRNPKPILTRFNLELIEVQSSSWEDIYEGQITVKMPGIKVCSANDEIQWNSLDLSRSPFGFDESQNALVSVGCHGSASLYKRQGHRIGGCSSTCNPPGQVIDGCNGYYCCQFQDVSNIAQEYTVGVTSGTSNGSAGNETSCRSAFLTSRVFLQADNSTLSAAMINNSVLPVVLYFLSPREGFGAGSNDFILRLASFLIPVLGISLGIASISCFWWCCLWKRTNGRQEVRVRKKYFKRRLKEEWSSNMDVVEKTKLFPLKVLKSATNNFHKDRILGQGGQGTVYKGMLANGEVIAIKKSKAFDDRQWKEFINEVILLSKLYHRNVVKLLGCCLETKAPMLVYEFIANGTLSEHIHKSKEVLLTWEMRKRIASEVAGAISYLHSSLETPIYHRDIKSTNILLGENYHAKVADFGISRVVPMDKTHMTTGVQGTFGYLDPEYFRLSRFTEKSDVYSFGVILVELLTGEHSIRKTTSEGEKSLVVYFVSSMDASTLDEILDPTVLEGNEKKEVMLVADLAKRCLKPRGIERPTMKEVAMELEGLQKRLRSTADAARLAPLEIEDVAAKSAIEMGNAHTSPVMCKDISIEVGNSDDERPLYGASW